MRIQVAYDGRGKILAALPLPDERDLPDGMVSIVPQRGVSVGSVEVPYECETWTLMDLCQRHRVTTVGGAPALKALSPRGAMSVATVERKGTSKSGRRPRGRKAEGRTSRSR
jgi:hypothetical protein